MSSVSELNLIHISDSNFHLVHSLVNVSKLEGFKFVQRTVDDWQSGANKFSEPGEKLFGILSATDLIGIGGLSRDPYIKNPNFGRVRHLYIQQTHRRKGYATLLMNAIMNEARLHFTTIRLFTDNPAASIFYESLGFQQVDNYKVSHVMNF
jgi:GNAT superfamily N-acetyltransferase